MAKVNWDLLSYEDLKADMEGRYDDMSEDALRYVTGEGWGTHGDGGSPADAEEHAHVRGLTLARADSTPVMMDLSGTRMDPLDRAPLRQRIIGIVLSTSLQGSSCLSAPLPVPLIAW